MLHSKTITSSVFPPQKLEQREICKRSVQRETFLHSLDRIGGIAHAPLITKIAYKEEIPPLSFYQHASFRPVFSFFWFSKVCVCAGEKMNSKSIPVSLG